MREWDATQMLPTISWVTFYVAPLALLNAQTPDLVAPVQLFGAGWILLMLLLGDSLSSVNSTPIFRADVPPILVWLLAALVIMLPLAHVLISGELPILGILAGESAKDMLPVREHFNKDIPRLTSYAFQYVLSVFGPVLIGIAMMARRHGLAIATLLWCLTYALASGAKWPALILLFTGALIWSNIGHVRWRKWLAILAISAGVLFFLAAERLSATMAEWVRQGGAKDEIAVLREQGPISVGDMHRLAEALDGPTHFGRSIDYLIYRVYLGPVEVASRWYDYFPGRYGHYLGMEGILEPTKDGRAPSNIIGSEVYRKRFPDRYLDSASAYTSVDADAHAHWGVTGIVCAGLALLLTRLLILIGARTHIGRVCQLAQIAILTTVPFQGSIQAIVFSQGVLLLLLIQFLARQHQRGATPAPARA